MPATAKTNLEKTCRIHELKPDYEQACRRWEAFWQGEIIDRPVISVIAPRDGRNLYNQGLLCQNDKITEAVERANAWIEGQYWGGDAIPRIWPNPGPDIFAAWLGAHLVDAPDASTNWVEPCVERWEQALPLRLDKQNPHWKRTMAYLEALAGRATGRWVVAGLDLHSNLDALSAIRSPQQLCMDLLDQPENVERALRDMRALYGPVSEAMFKAGNAKVTGSMGWIPMYSKKKYNVVQCDFCYMISPELFRRFVLPALEEEVSWLDHSVYHLDGTGALRHLDDLLALPRLNAIQWVPGAGAKPLCEWLEVLKKIIAAGKNVHVYCPVEQVELFHRALGPRRVFYECWAKDEAEARRVVEWLEKN